MAEKLLTSEQVAQILQVHPFTVHKYLKEGKLKGIKLGRVWRIRESDMEQFLEERFMASPSAQTHSQKQDEDKPDKTIEPTEEKSTISPKEGTDHYIID